MSSLTVTLPRLIGVRESVQRLLLDANIPEDADLSATEVIFDFTNTLSIAQGACDELVKQMLERGSRSFVFSHPSTQALEYLERAVRLRSKPDTVTIVVK